MVRSRPVSTKIAWSPYRPILVISPRQVMAGSTAASGPVSAWGLVVPSTSTPRAGIAAINSRVRMVRRPVREIRRIKGQCHGLS